MKVKDHKLNALFIILILIITYVAFSHTLGYGFVEWDENAFITENPDILGFSWGKIGEIFTSSNAGLYSPLVVLSFSIENNIFGMKAGVFRTTNLILHLLNCFLLFWLILKISDNNTIISFIVTAFFGIHPLHIESVVWIVERKDVLSTFFYLGSLILFIYFRKMKSKRVFYYFSIVFYLLALLSKVMAISLPFVLILMDRIFFTKDLKKCIITQIPYLFISVLFFITSMIVITSGDLSTGSDKLEIFQRILLVLYLFIFYIYKLFIPLNLSARYPIEINELLPTPIWTLLLIPILFFLLLLFFYKDKKNVTFGILFFLITLLPITPLIFLGFPYGDRYSYIPSIGIFYIFGAVINYLLQKKTRFFIIKKVCIAVGIAAIILFLTVQTRKHSKIWENNFTLWNNVIKTNPTNAIGYNNRGVEYLKNGYQREAMMDFRKALERNPNHVKTHNNIGIIFLETKDYQKAIYFFTIAVKLNPNYSDAYFNRGCAWGNLKNFEEAINDFSTAIKINPKFIKAYYYRAITYERLKMFEKAKHDFQKIYKLDPNFPLKKTFEYKNGKPGKTGSVFLRLDLEDEEFS